MVGVPPGKVERMRRTTSALLARLAIPAAVLLVSGCEIERSALTPSCSGVDFGIRPRYVCPGESVTLTWNAPSRRVPCEEVLDLGFGENCLGERDGGVDAFLSSEPENLFEPPGVPPTGTRTIAFAGADDAVEETVVTFTASRQFPDDRTAVCNIEGVVRVVGIRAVAPHQEAFVWGCENGRGGGPGWSPVDYEPGQIASANIEIRGVENASPFPIRVGMRRDRPDGTTQVESVLLAAGASTTTFDGPFYGAWDAAHADPASFGPDGCEGSPPGDVAPTDEPPPVIAPRPDVEVVFRLICTGRP